MTVSTAPQSQVYSGDGSNLNFPIPGVFFDPTDVKVWLRDSSVTPPTEALLTNPAQYSISGSNVVMVTAPSTQQKVFIKVQIALSQGSSYLDNASFAASNQEKVQDRAVLLAKQIQEQVDRSVKLPNTVQVSDFDPTLPQDIALNPGATLIVDPVTGKKLVAGPSASSVLGAQAAATAAAASQAAAAASATSASGSASAAASSATAAASSAAAASTSAGNAATSATNSAASASSAASSTTTAINAQKAQPNGIATLDSGGKIPSTQLPAIVVNNVYTVVSQAAMLALSADVGDTAVRTDVNQSFMLQSLPASTLGNWIQLLTPTAPVQSVNGFTGTVTLITDNVNEGATNKYYTDARARASLSAGSGISYNSATGVISLGAGGGSFIVTGSTGAPQAITAGGGIAFTGTQARSLWFITGSGSAVQVTATPQIAAGTTVGQELLLIGTSDTNSVTLAEGTGSGLSLNGPMTLSNHSSLHLIWDGAVWAEIARRQ